MVDTDVKELRVKIDMSFHLKLHALKLLRNKKMAEAVEEALDLYFAEVVGIDEAIGRASNRSPPPGTAPSAGAASRSPSDEGS